MATMINKIVFWVPLALGFSGNAFSYTIDQKTWKAKGDTPCETACLNSIDYNDNVKNPKALLPKVMKLCLPLAQDEKTELQQGEMAQWRSTESVCQSRKPGQDLGNCMVIGLCSAFHHQPIIPPDPHHPPPGLTSH